MPERLSRSQMLLLIEDAIESFPHEECAACECFLGYISQLELDSGGVTPDLVRQYKPDRKEVHSCLGCDPCPPADHFAKYLRENRRTTFEDK